MASDSNKKLLILYILDVLKEYSDFEHQLTQGQIINYIYKRFGMECERKAVSRNIDFLMDYGYDIVKGERGCYLAEREFDSSEIVFLVDSVFSNKSLPNASVQNLVKKLAGFSSVYERKTYKHLFKPAERGGENIQYFLNIELLNSAIDKKKKVKFNYVSYEGKNGNVVLIKKEHIVSPYFMVNNNGKYYLVCNKDGKPNVSNYKIENIVDIVELDQDIEPINSFEDVNGEFSEINYINSHIYMFGGKVVNSKIELLNNRAIGVVYEWFGKNTTINCVNGVYVANVKSDEQALCYWALQYAELVKVVSPESLKQKIAGIVKSLSDNYKAWKLK